MLVVGTAVQFVLRLELDIILSILISITSSAYSQLLRLENSPTNCLKTTAEHKSLTSFSQRIFNVWNTPPVDVDFSSLGSFKRSLLATDLSTVVKYFSFFLFLVRCIVYHCVAL